MGTIKLTKEKLAKLCERDRTLFLLLGNATNELTILQKLMMTVRQGEAPSQMVSAGSTELVISGVPSVALSAAVASTPTGVASSTASGALVASLRAPVASSVVVASAVRPTGALSLRSSELQGSRKPVRDSVVAMDRAVPSSEDAELQSLWTCGHRMGGWRSGGVR